MCFIDSLAYKSTKFHNLKPCLKSLSLDYNPEDLEFTHDRDKREVIIRKPSAFISREWKIDLHTWGAFNLHGVVSGSTHFLQLAIKSVDSKTNNFWSIYGLSHFKVNSFSSGFFFVPLFFWRPIQSYISFQRFRNQNELLSLTYALIYDVLFSRL